MNSLLEMVSVATLADPRAIAITQGDVDALSCQDLAAQLKDLDNS